MPLGIQNLEFLNLNSQRSYPLADDSTGIDTTGSFTLPRDFVLSLDLPVHAGLVTDPGRFFLKHVGVYANGYSLVVGYQPLSGDPVDVATALIVRDTHVRNQSYALGGVGDYDDTIGKVVIGRLDSIDAESAGFWTFSFANGRLDPDAVRPILRGLSSLVVVNGSTRSAPLYGDIELIAGSNMRLTPITVDDQNAIRFDAISGEGLTDSCICEGETDPPVISTINGIAPVNGNLNLLAGDCISVTPITNGLRIADTCSRPCCGCPELEAITDDLERFGEQAAASQQFIQQLRSTTATMDMIVLGSRLGDACTSCE